LKNGVLLSTLFFSVTPSISWKCFQVSCSTVNGVNAPKLILTISLCIGNHFVSTKVDPWCQQVYGSIFPLLRKTMNAQDAYSSVLKFTYSIVTVSLSIHNLNCME
jgi:hypothetical protein